VKAQDDPYRYNATVLKMLVKVEVQGGLAKVWGTMPAALDAGRGDRVAFDAKVTPKERGFGFFSRPTKAEVVA
jgi:hypothetical protein